MHTFMYENSEMNQEIPSGSVGSSKYVFLELLHSVVSHVSSPVHPWHK